MHHRPGFGVHRVNQRIGPLQSGVARPAHVEELIAVGEIFERIALEEIDQVRQDRE